MVNLLKAYSFDGACSPGLTMGNLDRKLILFTKRCRRADIAVEGRHRAISSMLTVIARQYYLDSLVSKKMIFSRYQKAIKDGFQTAERTHALVS